VGVCRDIFDVNLILRYYYQAIYYARGHADGGAVG